MTKSFARVRNAFATVALTFIASPATASSIIPTYIDVGDPERAVVDAAIRFWEDLLPGSLVFDLTIESSFLGGTLAVSSDFVEEHGLPIGASITFDDGTSGIPWFIDETPSDDREFRSGRNPFHGVASSGPAAGAFDLLTVIQHELGHALGFSIFYPPFAAHVIDASDGNRTYLGPTVTARLTGAGAGTHTLPEEHPFDLMNPELDAGHRLNPSPLNLALLHEAFGYDVSPARPIETVETVPEPEGLFAVGLFLLVVARRLSSTGRAVGISSLVPRSTRAATRPSAAEVSLQRMRERVHVAHIAVLHTEEIRNGAPLSPPGPLAPKVQNTTTEPIVSSTMKRRLAILTLRRASGTSALCPAPSPGRTGEVP